MKRVTPLLAFSALMLVAAGLGMAQDSESQYMTIERRTPQQMSAEDAELLKARGADVIRAAAFFNIDLEQGSWTYQQSICPLMPKHLIVNYVRQESPGVETQFAAVVPRGTEPVRIAPVQRSGLAPFAPAETSNNSVAMFNRVWSSEGGNLKTIETESNWITLGLCYAEMVGSHPLIVSAKPLVERNAGSPILRYEARGGAASLFTDIGLPAQTWSWTLEFDRRGSLVRVERERLTQPLLHQARQMTARTTAPPAVEPVPAAPVAAMAPQTKLKSADVRGSRMLLPDSEAPAGRIIPDAQEAPSGRIIPGPQELPFPK